jgi:ABC-type nitrate/sulfonate/bicarbonate transport system ATPase subunit
MTLEGQLEIRSVEKRFQVSGAMLTALEGVELTVQPGEFLTVVGASGCGKSTLLRLIAGLDRRSVGVGPRLQPACRTPPRPLLRPATFPKGQTCEVYR